MLTEAIKELSKEFPSLAEPLIFERDRYMVLFVDPRVATKTAQLRAALPNH